MPSLSKVTAIQTYWYKKGNLSPSPETFKLNWKTKDTLAKKPFRVELQ